MPAAVIPVPGPIPLLRLAVVVTSLALGGCIAPIPLGVAPPPDDRQRVYALEKACLPDPPDPSNARAWQHLALVQASAEEAPLAAPELTGMARVVITQSDGMARLQRVAGTQRRPEAQPLPQLEVLNGNGVPGMAGAVARSLAAGPVQLLRFGNAASFRIARTRIEYRGWHAQAARLLARQIGPHVEVLAVEGQGADLRLIVGRDMADAAVLHRFYLQQLQLARQALARLG